LTAKTEAEEEEPLPELTKELKGLSSTEERELNGEPEETTVEIEVGEAEEAVETEEPEEKPSRAANCTPVALLNGLPDLMLAIVTYVIMSE
jgi:hypothetical protein